MCSVYKGAICGVRLLLWFNRPGACFEQRQVQTLLQASHDEKLALLLKFSAEPEDQTLATHVNNHRAMTKWPTYLYSLLNVKPIKGR